MGDTPASQALPMSWCVARYYVIKQEGRVATRHREQSRANGQQPLYLCCYSLTVAVGLRRGKIKWSCVSLTTALMHTWGCSEHRSALPEESLADKRRRLQRGGLVCLSFCSGPRWVDARRINACMTWQTSMWVIIVIAIIALIDGFISLLPLLSSSCFHSIIDSVTNSHLSSIIIFLFFFHVCIPVVMSNRFHFIQFCSVHCGGREWNGWNIAPSQTLWANPLYYLLSRYHIGIIRIDNTHSCIWQHVSS